MASAVEDAKLAMSGSAKPAEQPETPIPLQDLQHTGIESEPRDGNVDVGNPAAQLASTPDLPPIDKRGFFTLLAQHVSSSWNARSCEFAFYLFLIELFPNTLVRLIIYNAISGTLTYHCHVASCIYIWLRLYWDCHLAGWLGWKLGRQDLKTANRADLHRRTEVLVST